MIEMRLLEILSAFAEEGTQTAAAEKLHISQPALSSSMRKLEEEIGAPLFEHTKNRMVLNENGQAAAEYAERILREEVAMQTHIQEQERRKHTVSFALCSNSQVAKITMVASQAFPDMQQSTAFCTDTEEMVQGLAEHLYTFKIIIPLSFGSMTKVCPGTSPVASAQVGKSSGEVGGEVIRVNLDVQKLNALLEYCKKARSRT